ncbi:MAG: hypothetical protein KAJ14_10515 [Candidatus Omnitrophica bacterium]|nr:hypothetical protein [Candidatus Omnitrophota bacterium]
MTKEVVTKLVRALAVISITVGGLGSLLCIPYALTTDLSLITTAGIYLIAGGIMIVGGLITMSLMLQLEK